MNLTLQIESDTGSISATAFGEEHVLLVYNAPYKEGDKIVLSTDTPHINLMVQLEDSMAPALTYMGGNRYILPIPFSEKRVSYSPKSFTGNVHLLFVRKATKQEVASYQNLAYNPYDSHHNTCLYPHATANVETRGESVFAARNAIDGHYANNGHGPWPYQSWGINQQADAEICINFGHSVTVDRAVLTTRADFPHDNWWIKGTLRFSDGSTLEIPLGKKVEPQSVSFPARKVDWVVLENLVKSKDPSPFPALTQIEFWGTQNQL